MSILADGLFEVCKATPEDPLEFLAKYLFKRALDVPDPDPWNYKWSDKIILLLLLLLILLFLDKLFVNR